MNTKITQSQTNPFEFSLDNKRYHTWNYHLNQKFGGKVFKVSINAGFTCPNIDGTKGLGGCTYCSGQGSGDFAGDSCKDVVTQFNHIKQTMHQKWPDARYIAYFQAFTNTYAPLEVIKQRFEPVLAQENVIGLSVATRADALADDVLDYLQQLSQRTYLVVELGLQTVHDQTAMLINRGHTYSEFLDGYHKLTQRGINVCVHIINGLPNETKEMMIETVKELARLKPHSVKIHLLHVLKGTVMAKQLESHEFSLLTQQEYVNIVCDQLEFLPKEVIIQRVTGDGAKDQLIGPLWSLKKFVVMNEIDKELLRRNSFQGYKFN
ncbi:MAG: hypothetical protein K0R90_1172 [Oscillospiraceae bacterium]|nr:hypothetical protein [Oscillospiraceae bacterium]